MDKNNQNRFEKLNMLLKKVQVNGGNIAIPSYSYSYTKNEIYNVLADLQVTTINGVIANNIATKGLAIAMAVAL